MTPAKRARLEAQKVQLFNEDVPVGTAVYCRKGDGSIVETRTRSRAELLSGHTAVVWLDGVSGCYMLDRVTVRETAST